MAKIAKKRTAKRKKAKPGEKELKGDDGTRSLDTGRWVKGKPPGPGRPKGIDFKVAVEDHARANGLSMADAAWEMSEKLRERGMDGDTPAAKLWMDRCYGMQKQEIDVKTVAVVFHSEQARADLRDMMGQPDAQDAMLDALEEKAGGEE